MLFPSISVYKDLKASVFLVTRFLMRNSLSFPCLYFSLLMLMQIELFMLVNFALTNATN